MELKIGEFEPEHLSKMEFYLEALDRDIRKADENPSVGLILCTKKDATVVEYALSRSLSPAMIASAVRRYTVGSKRVIAKLPYRNESLASGYFLGVVS
ncbi:PDDEXK nuclease domain-containing protein [Desulfitobacterium hafniense]|nr:PDDEXK nuclease domain-containing protein [Desulfitobacterium hafniense]